VIPIRPPGRVTRTISRTTAAGSPTWCKVSRHATRSNAWPAQGSGRRRQQPGDPVQALHRETVVGERWRLDGELLPDGVVVGTGHTG
jgi:hypothetical protein